MKRSRPWLLMVIAGPNEGGHQQSVEAAIRQAGLQNEFVFTGTVDGAEKTALYRSADPHVHRNTLARSPASEAIQRFLREALRVIRAATDISGDVNRALFWYRNEPLALFGYKTAEMLVSEGRTEDVLRYVVSLEAGAAG